MNRRLATMTLAPCLALGLAAATALAATDNAGNAPYADGWQAGDNGGTGFGPWTFAFSGDAGALVHPAPQFIDTAPPLAGNSLGAPAFALTTSARPFFFDTSEAGRTLGPMAVGQIFKIDVDGSALDPQAPGFSIGNTVQLQTAAGTERFGLFTNNQFNGDNWTATGGANTGVAAGAAFHLEVTLTGADTYDMVMTPVGGGAPLFSQVGGTLSGPAGSAITLLRVSNYGTGSSAGGSTEIFFNNVVLTPEPGAISLALVGGLAVCGLARRRKSA